MFNRQLVLLKLIQALEKKNMASGTAIVKALFLLKEEYGLGAKIKFYSFYPYQYGPFSQLCFADLRQLKSSGLVDEEEKSLTKEGKKAIDSCKLEFDTQLTDLTNRFKTTNQMIKYIYSKYPQYAAKSLLVEHENKQANGFCTIGYEGRDIDTFLDALIQNNVNTVIDVRNNPFSMNFCFIKDKLKEFLSKAEIDYMHIPELGIESGHRQNLKTKEDYKTLFKLFKQTMLPKHKDKLKQVGELTKEKRIALMCFEKDKEFCHRNILSEELEAMGYGEGMHL